MLLELPPTKHTFLSLFPSLPRLPGPEEMCVIQRVYVFVCVCLCVILSATGSPSLLFKLCFRSHLAGAGRLLDGIQLSLGGKASTSSTAFTLLQVPGAAFLWLPSSCLLCLDHSLRLPL